MEVQSDSFLVKEVLEGDCDAYGLLFEHHERSVLAVALSVLGEFHSAQDVVQESFLIAYEKLSSLRNGSLFGPWIRKIALREAVKMSRIMKKREDANQHIKNATAFSDNGEIDVSSRRLLEAVMSLPVHERTVVMLRYFDNHSTKMISKITGRPIGTVTMQLSRAPARLNKLLKGIENEKERK